MVVLVMNFCTDKYMYIDVILIAMGEMRIKNSKCYSEMVYMSSL